MRLLRSMPLSWLFAAAIGGLVLWILFFDSHSVMNRVLWHYEYQTLSEENEALREDIRSLEDQLEEPLSDEAVERMAREEYGMVRPGETIYRIERDD